VRSDGSGKPRSGCLRCAADYTASRPIDKDARRAYMIEWRKVNQEKILDSKTKWNKRNAEKCKLFARKSYKKHSEKRKASAREYVARNKEKTAARIEKWKKENIERFRKTNRERTHKRYFSDPSFRLASCLRARVRAAFQTKTEKRTSRSAGTRSLLGCSFEFAKSYIEARFLPGMTWDNQGKWQIDHIRPCASFDLTDPDQQRQCFHYSNLQPLWATDNRKKWHYMPPTFQAELI